MTTRRVIYPSEFFDRPEQETTMSDDPAPVNRPLTDDERMLMLMLGVRVIADQVDIPHTADNCPACTASAAALDSFMEQGDVHLHGDEFDCYLSVGPNEKMVHATREWLAFHAEHPEAIDTSRHRRPLEGG
jgi:hypothetical protein